jgi:hypothetical protein
MGHVPVSATLVTSLLDSAHGRSSAHSASAFRENRILLFPASAVAPAGGLFPEDSDWNRAVEVRSQPATSHHPVVGYREGVHLKPVDTALGMGPGGAVAAAPIGQSTAGGAVIP